MGICFGHLASKGGSITSIPTKMTSLSSSNLGQHGSEHEGIVHDVSQLRVFTFEELMRMTKNFKLGTPIKEGEFSPTYKGWVEGNTLNPAANEFGMQVYVKKIQNIVSENSEEWQSMVNFLGRLSHPNLVKLFGYCWKDEDFYFVYEYMPKGSLENHLFKRGVVFEPLSWSVRLKILIGVAKGLAFLHSLEKQVIHRDLKPSSILLDSNFNAKLFDFGLAIHGPSAEESYVSTEVKGTFVYAAPEYVMTGCLYTKSDVYGFGVVLLEMLTGQKALDKNRPSTQCNLVEWAKPMLNNRRKVQRLLDPQLEGKYLSKETFRAAQLSLKCLSGYPNNRPSMDEVVETLEKIEAMQNSST